MNTRMLSLLLLLLISPVSMAVDLVAEGGWSKIDFDASGSWRISREGGKLIVSLSEDFETKDGPDLYLLFSRHPLARVNNGNANESSDQIGLLKTSDTSILFKKMKGAQRFELPGDTDLSQYRSILIHCVEYSHLWAGADLPAGIR